MYTRNDHPSLPPRSTRGGNRQYGKTLLSSFFLAAVVSLGDGPHVHAKGRDSKFGHFRYKEAPAGEIVDVGPYRASGRTVKLRQDAAQAFQSMAKAARREGTELVPISGFRAVKYQKGLFSRSRKKHGSSKAAAQWVAPPGYSEHHTGRALDIGDGKAAAADVDPAFEKTGAFLWLYQNAARFGFEMSFPKNNPQGIGYEPWHWRYIGNEESRLLFHPQ